MDYFWWRPKDDETGWVFFEDDAEERLVIKERYKRFACAGCRKIDQLRALQELGVDPGYVPVMAHDYQATADGLACISVRMLNAIGSVSNLQAHVFPVLLCPTHVVIWPTLIAPVEVAQSTVRFHRPRCEVCGQHLEVTLVPDSTLGVTPPEQTGVFSLQFAPQGRTWRATCLYMSADLEMQVARLRPAGAQFHKCSPIQRIQL